MINFCLYIFIFYAVASSAKAILLSGKAKERKKSRQVTSRQVVSVQKSPYRNKIIKLNQSTARRGKTPLRAVFFQIPLTQSVQTTSYKKLYFKA